MAIKIKKKYLDSKIIKNRSIPIYFILILLLNLYAPNIYATELNINILGVPEEIKNTISSNITLNKINKKKLNPNLIESLHHKSIKEITNILHSNGYYNSKVKTSMQGNNINYDIILGKATIIKTIDLKILDNNLENKSNFIIELSKLSTLQLNNVIIHKDYEDTKESILNNLQEQGYLNASFAKNELIVNQNYNTAKIVLHINTGKRYYIGDISFTDLNLDSCFLYSIIPLDKGDPFTVQNVDKLQKYLSKTNLFSKIRIYPNPHLEDPNDYLVPIKIKLILKPKKIYLASAGYGTDTGIRGSLGWTNRRVTETAHRLETFASLSDIKKIGKINYIVPGKNPAIENYITSFSLQEEEIADKYSQKNDISVSKKIDKDNIIKNISLFYTIEHFRESPTSNKLTSKFLLPSTQFIWTNDRSQLKDKTLGNKTELKISAAHKSILSSANILKTQLNLKLAYPFIMDSRIILNGSIGGLFTSAFDKTPISFRYFAGGDKSIRGFKLDSIGPTKIETDGNKTVIGGKYLILAGAELDKPISDDLSAAIFLDAGNATNKFRTKYAAGIGVGLRWHTPIGSLRIDLARQIRQINSRNIRLHLNFGTDL